MVSANDYNPNTVAPPEMELLRLSIAADGYTQPIVVYPENGGYTVVDGFHRTRVGKECRDIQSRLGGYLPVVVIKPTQEDRGDRIASTIRHNRARGKHRVEAMSDIVIELKRRNWSDDRVGRELGMDQDEVLRLTQIAGLQEMFEDRDFSEAWEHDGTQIEQPTDESEEQSEINLEWMADFNRSKKEAGWHHRTEISSVLYGDFGKQLGLIQKSRFSENEWFVYVYTAPVQEFRESSKEAAMERVERHW